MSHRNGLEEDSVRNIGPKQSGDYRVGERLQVEVVMMDKDHTEKLEMEEHVSVPEKLHITREDLEALEPSGEMITELTCCGFFSNQYKP